MSPTAKSTVGTLVLGFIGVPLLLTFVCGSGGGMFFGPPQAFVAVLLSVLVASVGGYLLGARQDAAAMAGRPALIWTLVGTCC